MVDRIRTAISAAPWPLTIVALLALQLGPLPLKAAALLTLAAVGWAVPAILVVLVPATAPYALIPVALTERAALPIHEFVWALAVAGWAWQSLRSRAHDIVWRRSDGWVAVLVLAAAASLLWVLPEGRGEALRVLRWVIVEPVVWYFLLRSTLRRDPAVVTTLVHTVVVSSACIAALGLLQFVGVDLVPLLGEKRVFADNVVATGNIRRVAAVYGHANNLGLLLERALPLAVLAAYWRTWRIPGRWAWAAVIAAGLVVSFSRGAWLATLVAVAVGVVLTSGAAAIRRRPWLIAVIALAGCVGVAATVLTRGTSAGSFDARVLLWGEAVQWIQQRPLGLGLGQFYFFHNPEYGHSIIDPSLVGSSEQYAAHPHNIFLDAWLNLGPLGLLALLALVVGGIRQALAAATPLHTVVVALLIGTAVHGLVDQYVFVSDLALWFWLAQALAAFDTPDTSRL